MADSTLTRSWKLGVMAVNCGLLIYAITLMIVSESSRLTRPVPMLLLALGVVCILLNFFYLIFNLAPLFQSLRLKFLSRASDQKDITTQGTMPKEAVVQGYDEETVAIDADPVNEG